MKYKLLLLALASIAISLRAMEEGDSVEDSPSSSTTTSDTYSFDSIKTASTKKKGKEKGGRRTKTFSSDGAEKYREVKRGSKADSIMNGHASFDGVEEDNVAVLKDRLRIVSQVFPTFRKKSSDNEVNDVEPEAFNGKKQLEKLFVLSEEQILFICRFPRKNKKKQMIYYQSKKASQELPLEMALEDSYLLSKDKSILFVYSFKGKKMPMLTAFEISTGNKICSMPLTHKWVAFAPCRDNSICCGFKDGSIGIYNVNVEKSKFRLVSGFQANKGRTKINTICEVGDLIVTADSSGVKCWKECISEHDGKEKITWKKMGGYDLSSFSFEGVSKELLVVDLEYCDRKEGQCLVVNSKKSREQKWVTHLLTIPGLKLIKKHDTSEPFRIKPWCNNSYCALGVGHSKPKEGERPFKSIAFFDTIKGKRKQLNYLNAEAPENGGILKRFEVYPEKEFMLLYNDVGTVVKIIPKGMTRDNMLLFSSNTVFNVFSGSEMV